MPQVFSCTIHPWALARLPRAVDPSEYFKLCQEGNLERALLSISGGECKLALKLPLCPAAGMALRAPEL